MISQPFLSILIPVYNWNIRPLLEKLHSQAESLQGGYSVEIIVVDDCSEKKYLLSENLRDFHLLDYIKSEKNKGRTATRNSLLQRSAGEYILFLDADMLPDDDDFLMRYIDQAQKGNSVICGGISYSQASNEQKKYSFYLTKSTNTEAIDAARRKREPWRYCFTSNIFLKRDIAVEENFDSRFSGYGFEDIEWAIRLYEKYSILHINNTCSHMGLLTKSQVFKNMRESIGNYYLLLTIHQSFLAEAGAVKLSKKIQVLPTFLLVTLDYVLSRLFSIITWGTLELFLFQSIKIILLSIERKKQGETARTNNV